MKRTFKSFRPKNRTTKRFNKKTSPTRRAYLAGLRAGKRIARSRRYHRRW